MTSTVATLATSGLAIDNDPKNKIAQTEPIDAPLCR